MNVGDKFIRMFNIEDAASLEIYQIDDVYEVSLTENVYECTLLNNIARMRTCIPIFKITKPSKN
jgi:hypothetical protein